METRPENRGEDCLTTFLSGIIGIPLMFLLIVWLFSGCD